MSQAALIALTVVITAMLTSLGKTKTALNCRGVSKAITLQNVLSVLMVVFAKIFFINGLNVLLEVQATCPSLERQNKNKVKEKKQLEASILT